MLVAVAPGHCEHRADPWPATMSKAEGRTCGLGALTQDGESSLLALRPEGLRRRYSKGYGREGGWERSLRGKAQPRQVATSPPVQWSVKGLVGAAQPLLLRFKVEEGAG